MSPFTQYKQWMIERYGEPLFRIPVAIASSCPHGQCAFCSEQGSKAQQTQKQENPSEQAEAAIQFSKRRYRAKKFMLYIQAFSADLTDPAQQQTIIDLLNRFDFEAISIGTRPDCLPPTALDFLEALRGAPGGRALPVGTHRRGVRDELEVWVELGVQTANDETLKTINRGHDWECSKKAILNLAECGIHVAPHIIIGLPGEQAEPAPTNFPTRPEGERLHQCAARTAGTGNPWNRTAEDLAKLPISGIKIHNLHIMKGTVLAKNPPPVLSHWEYAEALMEFLRRLPPDIPVMRISTDTPNEELIAPHWHLEKGQFLDYVLQQMTMREITQGDLIKSRDGCPQPSADGSERRPYPVVPTEDGSITFFSEQWKEHYHDKAGARLEAEKKYVEPSKLAEKLQQRDIRLLDVCFGLGYNTLAALESGTGFQPVQTGKMPVLHSLDITALEMDKRVVRAAAEQIASTDSRKILTELLQHSTSHNSHFTISPLWGDARFRIQQLENELFDIVFHDPFSSQHCPELWTVEFFQQLYRIMKPDGVLLTYSSALPVRGAMREAGFFIGETEPEHHMGNGTIAAKDKVAVIGFELVEQIETRRSIPYRDPHLCAPTKTILRNRQEAVEAD